MPEQTVLVMAALKPPTPWPILNTVFSFEVPLEGFFSSGSMAGLCPLPLKYCGFPACCCWGRRVVGLWRDTPQSRVRASLGHIGQLCRIYQSVKREGKLE